jgi:hypothetical protein
MNENSLGICGRCLPGGLCSKDAGKAQSLGARGRDCPPPGFETLAG